MIYAIYSIFFLIFIACSFWLYRVLLKSTDIMKYMFYILLYIAGILLIFQGLEKLMKYIFEPSTKEIGFMFLIYLLATMTGFLSVAIITIKKMRKK